MKAWPFSSPLQLALGVSVAFHAALLGLPGMQLPAPKPVTGSPTLDVILVNSKTKDPVPQARAIAQANLNGGGDADWGRATSPLPPLPTIAVGDDVEQSQALYLNRLQQQQQLLLAEVKSALDAMSSQDAKTASSEDRLQSEQRRRQLMNLLAEIERRIQMENARPRKDYISPSARQADYAIYYEKMRRSIEDRGTENFPQLNGQKLYGELVMIIHVNYDGRVLATEVVMGSGNWQLDQRARAIAESAGPFGAFESKMRQRVDQIAVVSRFKFSRDDTLQTRLEAP